MALRLEHHLVILLLVNRRQVGNLFQRIKVEQTSANNVIIQIYIAHHVHHSSQDL